MSMYLNIEIFANFLIQKMINIIILKQFKQFKFKI